MLRPAVHEILEKSIIFKVLNTKSCVVSLELYSYLLNFTNLGTNGLTVSKISQ